MSFAFAARMAAATDAPNRYQLNAGVDLSYVATSGHDSWTQGFVGKLLYDDNVDGVTISQAFVEAGFQLTDTLKAHAVANAYDDDLGGIAGFTQAYVEWRPVPRSKNRYRLKVGAFYPHLSLENVDTGCDSPYTMNNSAINTWVAEELRTVGAELSVSRRPEMFGGTQTFSLQGAVFVGNDPAGSLLAWKGWSAHNRQTSFSDKLPLPPLPVLEPGELLDTQNPYVEPFREIDGRAGYYVGGEWRFNQQLLIRAMHYDNRADPTTFEDGQYAWNTQFNHVAAQVALPGEWNLLFQWMAGSTVMGQVVDGAHIVDTEFDSKYLMLTRSFDRHRLSLRNDIFEITQNDDTDEDNNPENGYVWTLAYFYDLSDKLSFGAESMVIKTHRCGWTYYDIDETRKEKQLQLSVRLRFGR
jgi:hypothetical protein